jgi:subtilisin family serine protease
LQVPGRLLVGRKEGADPDAIEWTLRAHRTAVRREVTALRLSVVDVEESSADAVMDSLRRSGLFEYVERDAWAHTAADKPNDPSYLSQWHLPRIQGVEAWAMTTGARSVPVAVIDSGIFGSHPDLQSKLVPGWNFVAGTADTSDTMGHGSAVAGTIAAATNNGIGIASVNWASPVMPLVVVDAKDFAAYSDIAAAIQFAADHGVRIINISVGGSTPSAALQSAVDYAWRKGSVIFAAAMNERTATRYYPAACNHVVAVSATDSSDRLADFSNFGDWISLAAPGVNILTTANGGGYGFWSGTSFSSPIVAAVAALCLAVNPALTNEALVTLLEGTADDLGPAGFDASFGWGRVNAYRAVLAARPPVPSVGHPAEDPPAPRRGR